MHSNLNLASKPFSNRLLPWALTTIILFVSVIGLLVVVRLTTVAKAHGDATQAEVNLLRQQEQGLMKSAEEIKGMLSADQQQAVPAAHQLVDRRKFLWSKLLVDLENSLPPNVKVTRIAVRDVKTQGDQIVAELDVELFSKSPETINTMVSSMYEEGIFHPELRTQTLQKGRGEGGTEYGFDVIYRPRTSYAHENVAEAAPAAAGSEVSNER